MTDRFTAKILLPCALLLGIPVSAEESELAGWARGPVRYIAQKEELELYRGLESDGDRALYVERFWARRDPTPQTMTNEYRELFWERVRYSNERFLDSPRPGWQTDRGKIHILYGAPMDIEEYSDLRPGGDLTAGHGVIRWIYHGRPGGRADLDPIVVVPFQREPSGEYRLSTDPKLASVFFDALAVKEETPRQRALENFFGTNRGPKSELAVMLDLGKMQEVPPHAQVILERVETVEDYRTRPLETNISRFRHPDRPGTLVLLTVEISYAGAEIPPALVARFSPRDATRTKRVLGEDAFQVATVGERRFAQGRVVLEPGEYDLTLMAVDPLDDVPGIHRERILVEATSGRELHFSDVVCAADVASLRYAALASHDEPFQVGPFRVVPGVDRSFAPGDAVKVFYEVYEGQPPYLVSYTLEGLDVDGSWKQLGRPFEATQEGAAQAWELTTKPTWPLGDYRIRIRVRDQAENEATADLAFILAAAPPSPPTDGDAQAAGGN